MTAARQERKSHRPAALLLFLGLAATWWGLPSGSFGAATTERIVTNRHTGLAIDGFDPVAYFVDAAPEVGRAGLELRHAGVSWRFRNEGNRAAFAADPDVYMPRYGGHDPVAIARGTAAPGHPRLWCVTGQRLYLFYDEAARSAFLANPDRAIAAAERHWPDVLRSLTP